MSRHAIAEKRYEKNGLRILLVEDDLINQKVALNLLKHQGHKVAIAENGAIAIELFEKHTFHLILMDIQMPIMDGFTTTRKIRAKGEKGHSIPIIAMTAHMSEEFKRKCLSVGMDDFVSKPFAIESFYSTVSQWGRRHRNGNRVKPIKYVKPLYLEEALSRTMGDREFLKDILLDFLKELPMHFHMIKEALIVHDMKKLSYEAHQLKGVAANLSAHRISNVAGTIETRGLSGDINGVKQALMTLKTEGYRLQHFIQKEII